MDNIKEAFNKIKEDIGFLNNRINELDKSNKKITDSLINVCEILIQFKDINNKILNQNILIEDQNRKMDNFFNNFENIINKTISTHNTNSSTHNTNSSTHSTNSSTHNSVFSPRNDQNYSISTGNGGVPTDKQTNQQTNRQQNNILNINQEAEKDNNFKISENKNFSSYNILEKESLIDGAANILNSLDNIKKELRLKFKRLTEQELLVFSTIYQLDEELGYSDYKYSQRGLI